MNIVPPRVIEILRDVVAPRCDIIEFFLTRRSSVLILQYAGSEIFRSMILENDRTD